MTYDGVLVGDLIKRDTDLDGVPDWEESLYGTDINKKDSNDDGIPDNAEIANKKTIEGTDEENLTETEKFSREFMATAVALSQTGGVDQDTADKLSDSLIAKMQDSVVRKIYLISDIKITEENSLKTFSTYNNELSSIFTKYQMKTSVLEILQEFIGDGENENAEALKKLDPVIKQTDTIIKVLVSTTTPQSLSQLHLELVNALERLLENLTDISLFDVDPIMSIGAISKYEENTTSLENAVLKLGAELKKKLGN